MSWWIDRTGLGAREQGPRPACRRAGTKTKGPRFLASLLIGSICFLWFSPLFSYELTSLQPGLEYGSWKVPDLGNTLHALRIDLTKYSVRPIDARQLGSPTLSAKKMGEKTGALAVINANFFDPQDKPLGLVLINKKILNPPHPTRWWAVLLIKGNEALIGKVFTKIGVKGFDQGIQAGPRLVVGGHKTRLKEKASPKSVVAIDGEGRLWILASKGMISINALALFLATPKNRGGLGLQQALNLDGGSSTQFFLKAGPQELWLPGLETVPVGLGVFSKESASKN